MTATTYAPRPIKRAKRARRTEKELESILERAKAIIAGEDDRMSIRHLFYRLESEGMIAKSQEEYKKLQGHLTKWRRAHLIPWGVFTDNTRWHIGGKTFGSMEEARDRTVETYRRDLWETQDHYVEVWVEKDAIAGIVSAVADTFGVKTFVCRGNASLTSLYEAADTFRVMQERGKQVSIIYLGDHDPSGLHIDASARASLSADFGVVVEFVRAAVTPAQIQDLGLPTRPHKEGDRRAAGWEGGCVEVDAIPTRTLKQIVKDKITEHIEPGAWAAWQQIEEMEKETLRATLIGRRETDDGLQDFPQ